MKITYNVQRRKVPNKLKTIHVYALPLSGLSGYVGKQNEQVEREKKKE